MTTAKDVFETIGRQDRYINDALRHARKRAQREKRTMTIYRGETTKAETIWYVRPKGDPEPDGALLSCEFNARGVCRQYLDGKLI